MIKELTITQNHAYGWLCETDEGETAKLINDVVDKYGLKVGDKIVSVLVPHNNPHSFDYFCKWAVARTDEVNIEAVNVALQDVQECEPLSAEELGVDIGDLLYWDCLVDKFVRFKSDISIDSGSDVLYIQKNANVIVEYDE